MAEELGPNHEELEGFSQEEEPITAPEAAEQKLAEIWSGDIEIDALKRQFSLQAEESRQQMVRDDLFLASISEATGEFHPEAFNKVALVTSSSSKQKIVADLAAETGLSIQPTLQTELTSEEELKDFIKGFEAEPQIKAVDLAELKRMGLPHTESPVLSMDTIVIDESGKVLDKPKDKEAASTMISSLSGQNLRIVTGLALHYPSTGKALILRDGVEMELRLKNYTQQQVSQHLDDQGDKVQEITGGIDFSSEAGQNLIGDSEAINVRPLKLVGVSGPEQTEVKITKQALPALRTYFLGAPKHPIKFLLNQAKQISENW